MTRTCLHPKVVMVAHGFNGVEGNIFDMFNIIEFDQFRTVNNVGKVLASYENKGVLCCRQIERIT